MFYKVWKLDGLDATDGGGVGMILGFAWPGHSGRCELRHLVCFHSVFSSVVSFFGRRLSWMQHSRQRSRQCSHLLLVAIWE